jgi:hypothetical protein
MSQRPSTVLVSIRLDLSLPGRGGSAFAALGEVANGRSGVPVYRPDARSKALAAACSFAGTVPI